MKALRGNTFSSGYRNKREREKETGEKGNVDQRDISLSSNNQGISWKGPGTCTYVVALVSNNSKGEMAAVLNSTV